MSELTSDEAFRAARICIRRYQAGAIRPPEGKQHPFVGEMQGIVAEFAVARYFEVEPERWVVEGRDGPKDDLRVGDLTLSIKGTKYFKSPHLIVRPYDTTCDRYILVSVEIGKPWSYILHGWISGAGLEGYTPAPFLKGARPSRNVPSHELNPMSVW